MLSEKQMLLVLFFPPFLIAVHVHNDFLLAILTRCQIIVSTPGKICLIIYFSLELHVNWQEPVRGCQYWKLL